MESVFHLALPIFLLSAWRLQCEMASVAPHNPLRSFPDVLRLLRTMLVDADPHLSTAEVKVREITALAVCASSMD